MNPVACKGCAYRPTGVEHVANIISHAVSYLSHVS